LISLAVKARPRLLKFYQQLGFVKFHGDAAQNWLIVKNGDHVIGFQVVREEHPDLSIRLDQNAQPLAAFTPTSASCSAG
jgi:hypothetical protein